MAKANSATTEADIARRIRKGRGVGRGADYKPWLDVKDVPSLGQASRIKGWKVKRVHHFFSSIEVDYFYGLEWSPVVTDIREQYPLLPISETLEIAAECDIRHPRNPLSKQPIVMTTDFLITVRQSLGVSEVARTVKHSQELQGQRVLEKFEIERRYWEKRNISWGIVTEREIPFYLAKNIKWLHPFRHSQALPLSEHEIRHISTLLTQKVLQENASLSFIAAKVDEQINLLPGTSLSVARHLLATQQWRVDMNQPIEPKEKLVLLEAPLLEPNQQMGDVG